MARQTAEAALLQKQGKEHEPERRGVILFCPKKQAI
jgi:hypothetical protein